MQQGRLFYFVYVKQSALENYLFHCILRSPSERTSLKYECQISSQSKTGEFGFFHGLPATPFLIKRNSIFLWEASKSSKILMFKKRIYWRSLLHFFCQYFSLPEWELIPMVRGRQCDQKVRLFFNIWPFATIKIIAIMSQNSQSRLSILPNKK